MAFLYIWLALFILMIMLLIGKLIFKLVLASKGASFEWTQLNTLIITLAFITVFPIMVLVACVKRV